VTLLNAVQPTASNTQSALTIPQRSKETGQGLVEYALILVLISIVVIVMLSILAPRIPEILQMMIEALQDAPRYLQIALIVAMLIPLSIWIARLAPQLPKVLGIDVRQIELADWEYKNIEVDITEKLLTAGIVKQRDVNLSRGLWKLSVNKYLQQHTEARVSYDESQAAIVVATLHLLRSFNDAWQKLDSSLSLAEFDQAASTALEPLAMFLSARLVSVPQDVLQDRGRLYALNLAPWDSPLPATLPILIWRADDVPTMEEVEQLARQLLDQFESIKRVTLVIDLAGYRQARGLAMREWFETLRQVFAYDFIPFERDTIARILIAKKPRDVLARMMLPYVNLLSISPFILTGPAPDTMFFGRELEMRKVAERVKSNSYVLIAGRRFGKSSVLLRLHRVRLPAAGFRTIYHDCSTTPTSQAFLASAIRDWRPEPPPNAPVTFEELLKAPPTDKPLVLLLDEADKLAPADRAEGWRLFNMLRALSNSGSTQIVLSGERALREALRDSTGPLFNLANEILLGPLDHRAVEELVTRPLKQLGIELVNEAAIVRHIYQFTSGHPNVIQRLCHRLIEKINEQGTRRIALSDVEAIVEDPGFQRDDFLSTYWEASSPLEKIVSLLMAGNDQVRTLQAVRQALQDHCALQPKAQEIDDALQRLVDLRSILKRTPAGYDFAVEAFPRVVAGTMTLDDMLQVLTEQYREQSE